MFLILFVLISEGYFLQNRIIFDSVDKLSPVSNMAYSCLKNVRYNNIIHFESVSENVYLYNFVICQINYY